MHPRHLAAARSRRGVLPLVLHLLVVRRLHRSSAGQSKSTIRVTKWAIKVMGNTRCLLPMPPHILTFWPSSGFLYITHPSAYTQDSPTSVKVVNATSTLIGEKNHTPQSLTPVEPTAIVPANVAASGRTLLLFWRFISASWRRTLWPLTGENVS